MPETLDLAFKLRYTHAILIFKLKEFSSISSSYIIDVGFSRQWC